MITSLCLICFTHKNIWAYKMLMIPVGLEVYLISACGTVPVDQVCYSYWALPYCMLPAWFLTSPNCKVVSHTYFPGQLMSIKLSDWYRKYLTSRRLLLDSSFLKSSNLNRVPRSFKTHFQLFFSLFIVILSSSYL